jgi:integrase
MPYQRNNIWWISYYDPRTGKQVRRSAGTDFKEAKALEQKLRSESHRNKTQHRGDVTLDTVLTEYLSTRLTPQNKSTARHLTGLAPTWGRDLSPSLLRSHVKRRQAEGAAPGTINKELVMISAAINCYNIDHGTHIPNPVSGLKLREPEGKLRWLTGDEYARLISLCDGHLRAFVILAVSTGMRRGELMALRWSDVDMPRRLITLRAETTKAKKSRTIPLTDVAVETLESQRGHPLVFHGIQNFRRSFETACRNAGFTDVTPHTLRHTTASWMVSAGVPLYEVKEILGHSTIKVTERYAHLAPGNLRGAVGVLDSVIAAHDHSGTTRSSRAKRQSHF